MQSQLKDRVFMEGCGYA